MTLAIERNKIMNNYHMQSTMIKEKGDIECAWFYFMKIFSERWAEQNQWSIAKNWSIIQRKTTRWRWRKRPINRRDEEEEKGSRTLFQVELLTIDFLDGSAGSSSALHVLIEWGRERMVAETKFTKVIHKILAKQCVVVCAIPKRETSWCCVPDISI